jgi:hypothetical protein
MTDRERLLAEIVKTAKALGFSDVVVHEPCTGPPPEPRILREPADA